MEICRDFLAHIRFYGEICLQDYAGSDSVYMILAMI